MATRASEVLGFEPLPFFFFFVFDLSVENIAIESMVQAHRGVHEHDARMHVALHGHVRYPMRV